MDPNRHIMEGEMSPDELDQSLPLRRDRNRTHGGPDHHDNSRNNIHSIGNTEQSDEMI